MFNEENARVVLNTYHTTLTLNAWPRCILNFNIFSFTVAVWAVEKFYIVFLNYPTTHLFSHYYYFLILHWYWTNFTRNFINSYPCTWWSSTVTTWIGLLQSLTLFLSHAVRYHYRLFLSLHTPSDRGESRHMLPDPSIIKSAYFDLTSEMTSPNFYSTFLPWPCQFLLPLQSHCKVP